MKNLTLLTALAVGLCGCMTYSHTSQTGERTSVTAFLVRGDASNVKTETRTTDSFGTNYSRSVSLGSLKGETELDKLAGMAEAIARGVATGANPAKK